MNKLFILAFLLSTFVATSAQETKSPYSGQESRHIKALSHEEVQEYLSGSGMGLAKPGELNHYPGPKHVLQLAKELQLSKEQIAETQQVYDEMHQEAVRLGELYVDKEKELDRLFAAGAVDESQLELLISEIGKLQGELRFAHLKAHLRMKNLLTSKQVESYDELRGYNSTTGAIHHHKH